MDLFDRKQFEQRQLRRFDIAYKAESHLGDALCFYVDGDTTATEQLVEVRKRAPGSETTDTAVTARIVWR